jgi:hypothetical protein
VLPAGTAWRTDPADAAALRASYERTVAVVGRGPDIQPIPAHLLYKDGKRPRDAAPGEIEAVAAVMAGPAGLTLGSTDAAAASLAPAERPAAGPFRPGMQTPGDMRVRSVRQASALRAAALRSGTARRGGVRHQQ